MEHNLIKVFNPEKAQQLADMGFEYILDSINGKSVYAFFISKESTEYLNNNFEANDFFYDDMLRF